jgi:hypothetical protein
MQQAIAIHNFLNSCEQLLFSLDRPLTENEEHLIAYYCKEIFVKAVSTNSHSIVDLRDGHTLVHTDLSTP